MFDDPQKNVEDLFPDLPAGGQDEAAEPDKGAKPAEADGSVAADDLFLDLPERPRWPTRRSRSRSTRSRLDRASTSGSRVGDLDEQSLLDAIEIEVSAEEQAEIERRSRLEWFALHANTGHENKVKRNIEMAIKSNHMEESFGDVLVPIQEVTEMKNGKRVTTKKKFLPGYLLVEMLMTKETQHFINSVPGVTGFIGGTPQKPQPVPREEVDRILGRIKEPNEGKDMLEIPYSVGDSVQVMDGPFSDWVGIINEINHEKGKLKVMISIFGKDTPVELDFLQVKQV